MKLTIDVGLGEMIQFDLVETTNCSTSHSWIAPPKKMTASRALFVGVFLLVFYKGPMFTSMLLDEKYDTGMLVELDTPRTASLLCEWVNRCNFEMMFHPGV